VRDAEGAVIVDIYADERFADRNGDGDLGRVQSVDHAVGDQFQLAAEAATPATCEPGPEAARVAGSPATTADQRNQHGRNETQ
jgi:hypothetical protein